MELYKKYRPKTLNEIKGNEELVDSLGKLLSNPKECPSVFLFYGETGCGKTTLARIIANELKVKGNDYKEIDVADFNGIETARDIRRKMSFKAQEGKYRIFVLDECHALTGAAQNAFLKTLEDTPSHVKFILCTTDPGKLKPTFRGRCQQYQVNLLSESVIISLLKEVSKKEKQKVDKKVLKAIAKNTLGHPRNALQALQRVLATEPEKRLKIAEEIALVENQSIELCQALMGWNKAGWNEIRTILTGLKNQEAESIRRHVIGYAAGVLLKKNDPASGIVLEAFIEPFYNSGFPGLVNACFYIFNDKE